MARDYKYRAEDKKSASRHSRSGRGAASISVWQWMLITALLIAFAVFLAYLASRKTPDVAVDNAHPAAVTTAQPGENNAAANNAAQKSEPPVPPKPQFDFYTILPKKELVVPDSEIKTRAREERIGKAKSTKYILQAGSFKDFKEADNLRGKLALMGIQSRVHKTKVGNVTWSRVEVGPFVRMSSVSTIRARLRQSGIDVVVTEIGG